MSFETISLLLDWLEMGALLAILFRLSNTFVPAKAPSSPICLIVEAFISYVQGPIYGHTGSSFGHTDHLGSMISRHFARWARSTAQPARSPAL
jgi:hypothetical protein